ncbi:conjugal transfer protein TraB [Streptomyces sp. NPDC015501]|uniref:conjugal transfer protein TraB n=1 Tax=unclassified Streptomyces TaxID=2593676 RepID=UPI0011A70834|nr:conjugal transfer protein TraB [Streptomyces griseus subsp. griseus]
MSDLVPRPQAAPAPADGDNRYKALQAKLSKLGHALDDAALELEGLRRDMRAQASTSEDAARDVENADLDPQFVELTNLVSTALGGAAVEVRTLRVCAQETADLAHETRRTHSSFYGGLDEIRSGRREKTPKPGFFNR